MLVCRACNTRYEKGTRACPSCGRRSAASASDSASANDSPPPLSRRPKSRPKPNVDLELIESSVLEDSGHPVVAAKPTRSAPAPKAEPAPTPLDPDVEQVKMLLLEQPGLLGNGLGLYADEDGEPLGVDFGTPVGSIDLLCRDRKGSFVVVHLPAPDEVGDSVSAMLRRMGWVRKHLAEAGEEVRGIVVLEQLPEDLAYAAAGAAGAIAFKGFKLALTFHDLDS